MIRSVKFPSVNLDIGHIRNLGWASDNDTAKWIAYNRLRGQYMSALEHAIPERFFNDPQRCNSQGASNPIAGLPECPQGISAVKALATAAAQGQKIYTITRQVYQNNPNIVSSSLSNLSQDTKRDIQNALDAGFEVTAHESPITLSGWTGAGYTFIDPETGAGGYIIEGGSNGGFLFTFFLTVIAFLIVFLVVFPASFGLGLLLLGWEILNLIFWIRGINNSQNADDFNRANFGQAVGAMLGLLPTGAVALAEIVKWFGLIFVFLLTNLTLGW